VSDTTNITPGSIDVAFPVAGQDNDSQGFRQNFTAIQTSLTGAAGYIATLQDDTAKTNIANNFQGNNILNANLVQISHEAQVGTVPNTTSTKTLDFEEAAHYNLTFVINTTVQIRNLAGTSSNTKASKVTVVVRKDTTASTDPVLTWDIGAGKTLLNDGDALWSNFTLDNIAEHVMVEFISFDNTNVYGKVIGVFTA
jgi:hypothetical protein|tara:strand:- start:494 stop:1084 length:591 start_codon:yes stop_codon:yes gene_type:complete